VLTYVCLLQQRRHPTQQAVSTVNRLCAYCDMICSIVVTWPGGKGMQA